MVVRLVQLADVLIVERNEIAVRPGPFAQPPPEYISGRLQVDHEIWRCQPRRQHVVETLIDEELVVVEIQIRVNLVAVEEVIRDGELAEEIGLPQRRLLAVTRERVEQLRLKRSASPTRVEVGQKRIVGFIKHHGCIEPRAETIGERRLADADRPLDRNVPEIQSVPKYRERAWWWQRRPTTARWLR